MASASHVPARHGELPPVVPIDLALLADLPRLPLRARYLAESFMIGRHRSPLKGSSIEFTEYRQYQPGDDLRHVDWRLFARSDRLCLREFEEETQLVICGLLDTSASMSYFSRPGLLTKLDYARTILAAVGHVARRQRDAVGLALGGEEIQEFLRPRSNLRHLFHLFGLLDRAPTGGVAKVAACLETMAGMLPPRAIVVVASDFYEDPSVLRRVLERHGYDRREVIGLRVLDPIEVDFAEDFSATLVDLETAAWFPASSGEVRNAYLREFQRHAEELRSVFVETGHDWVTLRTDESPMPALAACLAHREHLLAHA
jgi:uncharacterized protein (DUF58 family)